MAVITNPSEHLFKHKHNKLKNLNWSVAAHQIDDELVMNDNPILLSNVATPSTPAAGTVYFYAKDDSGVSHLFMLDSDGTETLIGGGAGASNLAGLSDVNNSVVYDYGYTLVADGNNQYVTQQMRHADLVGSGTYDHTSIDSHITNLSNPHSVTAVQIGAMDLTTDQQASGVKTFLNFPVTPSTNPSSDYEVANKKYVDAIAVGLTWKEPVIDKYRLSPPATSNVGDRHICNTTAASGWLGHDEDIAQYTASGWYFYEPEQGWAVITTIDNKGWTYDSATPEWIQFNAAEAYTAGDGIDIGSNVVSVDYKANDGLTIKATELSVDYSNNAIGIVANKLDVLPTGITNAMLAGSIQDSKLLTISTTNKVNWAAVNKTGSKLDDLEDVNAGSPSDNQSLTWDSATSKWIPETITSGAGGIAYTNYMDVSHTALSPYTYYRWTNQPVAVTEFGNNSYSRRKVNLTNADAYRVTCGMHPSYPGYVNARLDLQYSLDGINFSNIYTHPSGSYCPENVVGANYVNYGSWGTIVDEAKADVWIRIVGVSGNAVQDPAFYWVSSQFRIPGGDVQTVVDISNYPSGLPVQDNGAYYTPITKTGNYSAAQTDTAVWTPAAGKRVHLLGVVLSTNDANDIQVECANVDVVPPMYFAAHGGAVISGDGELWHGPTNGALTITSTSAVEHSIMMWGYEAT